MFYSKRLKKEINISHCFFNRLGGKSKGIYKSLNCGRGSRDKKKYISKNLNIVSKKISNSYNLFYSIIYKTKSTLMIW